MAGATLVLIGCGEEAVAPGSREPVPLGRGDDALRLVEPSDGSAVHAGEAFVVLVVQRLRDGPLQGRGQAELSADGVAWENLGPPFPWSRQGDEFSAFATIPEPGSWWLRVRIPGHVTDPARVCARPVLPPAPRVSLVPDPSRAGGRSSRPR